MKLHKILFRAGLLALLAAGSPVASAAGESAMSDNFIVLGLAAALLIFAFTRKPEKLSPPAASCCAPAEEPAAEAESPAEEAASEEAPAEEGAAETSAESEETSPEQAG